MKFYRGKKKGMWEERRVWMGPGHVSGVVGHNWLDLVGFLPKYSYFNQNKKNIGVFIHFLKVIESLRGIKKNQETGF